MPHPLTTPTKAPQSEHFATMKPLESLLDGSDNPALRRVASKLRAHASSDPAVNYSRMHHRHSRS